MPRDGIFVKILQSNGSFFNEMPWKGTFSVVNIPYEADYAFYNPLARIPPDDAAQAEAWEEACRIAAWLKNVTPAAW